MSTEPIGAALGRDDAAAAARAPHFTTEPSNALAGIAAAIERVEALLTACGPGPQSADTVERIADIAFVLHERDVEASLCDALDAAVRELHNANAVKLANVQHVHQAAELLRELSQRVAEVLHVSPPGADEVGAAAAEPLESASATGELQTSEETSDGDDLNGEIPREGLFAAALLEDDEFARAVAELAASLPALVEPVEAVVVALRRPTDLAVVEPALAPEPEGAAAESVGAERPHEIADLAVDQPEPAPAPEKQAAEAPHDIPGIAADEREQEEPVAEALVEIVDLPAAMEPKPAAEPEAPVPETQHEACEFAADEPVFASEPEAAVAETPLESFDYTVHQPAPAPAQLPSEMGDVLLATKQNPAEANPTEASSSAESADEEPPTEQAFAVAEALAGKPKDDAISIATLLSETALSKTLAAEALDESAGSPDISLAPDHTAVLPPDAGTESATAGTPSPPMAAEVPANEIALAPAESPIAAPEAATHDEPVTLSPPAETADPTSDQIMTRPNGGEPAQIADEPNSHDPEDAGAEATAEADEQPAALHAHIRESSQSLLPELALVDPQDDPGDLFEPVADASPPIALADIESPPSGNETSTPSATIQTFSAAAASDPLAAMRALSAEELLALFT